MIEKRIYRLLISVVLTIVLTAILVFSTSSESPNRILVMLGGTMPEGLIQSFTYFFFFFGGLEVLALLQRITHENDAFTAHLLPETENWVIGVDDVNQLKLNMQKLEHSQKFLLTDLIKKSCTKYRLSKSSSEVLGLVDAQIRIYNSEMESEQSFIRYTAWAIPSVGFIGTVLGIAASLGYANEASTPEGVAKVTNMLAVAFDTTLVALLLSIVLMYGIHYLQKKQDDLFAQMNSYLIENLINRFYK
ncbi:MotA/TolQ/ExbB proton channel family protein [uncultured Bacteroides sp.]|uniref:MotA/TolQ/ExbB proton channel family protein n=1 Tax=uncultured Bacteroides sp. TaxID=162156 RepID=UPI00261C0FF1|nr:MotA/TolQ/ExbB proton channel family protein [uncultured Bacteroides sp.]